MTEINEIKKQLYRLKPTATMMFVKSTGIVYNCPFDNEEGLFFEVPLSDIGDAKFFYAMPAQQLIRWIQMTHN